MTKNAAGWEIRFDKKYARVHDRIDVIRAKVRRKKGWIIKWHALSPKELQELSDFDTIRSMCEKIADDTRRWFRNGKLPTSGLKAYRRGRRDVRRALEAVRTEIEERKPTFLEKLVALFQGVTKLILKALPSAKKILALAN
jgi:hypothetical protein